jgi:uncharacterized repeat protein (TIGR02543 family)
VGAFVGNSGSNPAHTASIDYFFNTASLIIPEDGDQNTLTYNTVGSGTVDVVPDEATYLCGDVVTLTATAAEGWSFGGWSGDLSGSANPITATMTGSRVVTATFTQDAYTLTVHKDGNGTVTVEPDQPTYEFGDVVTLTATPNTYWVFDYWSGDLTGDTSPKTLTMNGDKVVTATFEQTTYLIYLPFVIRQDSH